MFLISAALPVAVIAIAVEAVCGYPARLYAWTGHPVTWIGAVIRALDERFNDSDMPFRILRWRGVVTLALTIGVVACLSVLVEVAMRLVLGAWAFIPVGILASSLFAQRSLYEHVQRVAQGLDLGLAEGRLAVSHIVGRDPKSLDEAAVARAAIESLAENFSDGVVAPVFYTALAGLTGGAVYKAINTADSMIGHRTLRHEAYGWAAARLDDWVNLPASRLAAIFIVLAAAMLPGCSGLAAAKAVRRDARCHRSPNAGWPEAAMAGALGLRLAGPRTYDGIVVQDHWMGSGTATANAGHIRNALKVYRLACLLQASLIIGLLIVG